MRIAHNSLVTQRGKKTDGRRRMSSYLKYLLSLTKTWAASSNVSPQHTPTWKLMIIQTTNIADFVLRAPAASNVLFQILLVTFR